MPAHDPYSPDSAATPPGVARDSEEQPLPPQEPPVEPEAPASPEEPPAAPEVVTPTEEELQTEEKAAVDVKVGTTKEVLAWVNEVEGDERAARAQAALDLEHSSDEPRKGLQRELSEILGAGADAQH